MCKEQDEGQRYAGRTAAGTKHVYAHAFEAQVKDAAETEVCVYTCWN